MTFLVIFAGSIAADTIGVPYLSFSRLIVLTVLFLSIMIFQFLLKAPTPYGRKIMDHIEGFKMYLETAERDRFLNIPAAQITPEIYERNLPYAVALEVDQKWTDNFEKELSRQGIPPEKYTPYWYRGVTKPWYYSSTFYGNVGSSMSQAIAASSLPPGSSGGGGFAGGGGGGGGGGGW